MPVKSLQGSFPVVSEEIAFEYDEDDLTERLAISLTPHPSLKNKVVHYTWEQASRFTGLKQKEIPKSARHSYFFHGAPDLSLFSLWRPSRAKHRCGCRSGNKDLVLSVPYPKMREL